MNYILRARRKYDAAERILSKEVIESLGLLPRLKQLYQLYHMANYLVSTLNFPMDTLQAHTSNVLLILLRSSILTLTVLLGVKPGKFLK